MSDFKKRLVARDKHAILSSSVFELVFVVRPFGKNIHCTHKIPVAILERFDELPFDVFVGIQREAAGHF